MGWATGYIAKLQAGETVSFRPRGSSMVPKIGSNAIFGRLVRVQD
jgi:hypothetical protein